MKVILLIVAATVLMVTQAFAQSSLTDQINSVYAVQQQQDAARRVEQQRLEAKRRAERRRAEKQQAADRAAALAAMRQAEKQRAAEHAAAIAIAKKKEAEAIAERKDNERYEDKLRAMQIEQQELQIQAEKDRVARENDFINAQLKQQNAETDVIQSHADATRNVSSGEKVLLEKTGEARVKKESGIFK